MAWLRDGDAAAPSPWIMDRVQIAGAQARDQALNQREVHLADHLGLHIREAAEWAIPHPDRAVIVMPWFEALLGQRAFQSQPQAVAPGTIGPVALAETSTQPPGGVLQRGLGPAAAIGRDGLDQQAGRELIVPRRDGHHEFAPGPGVDLGRTASTRATAAQRPLVGGREQA
jgi:hypothetical protein